MSQNTIELPPNSEVQLQIVRHSLTEYKAQLLINNVVYGELTPIEGTTGTYTTVMAFRTAKSGNTTINIDKSWKFDFSLFRKIFGIDD